MKDGNKAGRYQQEPGYCRDRNCERMACHSMQVTGAAPLKFSKMRFVTLDFATHIKRVLSWSLQYPGVKVCSRTSCIVTKLLGGVQKLYGADDIAAMCL